MNPCKHPDLIVQRNYGYRWVTCTECHTDFIPVDKEAGAGALNVKAEWYRHALHDPQSLTAAELRVQVRRFGRVLLPYLNAVLEET